LKRWKEINYIILNGGRATEIFESRFADISVVYEKLPSTSPANVRFDKDSWVNELSK